MNPKTLEQLLSVGMIHMSTGKTFEFTFNEVNKWRVEYELTNALQDPQNDQATIDRISEAQQKIRS